jgi:LPXTG-motif cell wall-anchored protein
MKRFTIPFITFLCTFLLISNAPSIYAENNSKDENAVQYAVSELNKNLNPDQTQKQDDKVQLKIEDQNTQKKQLRAVIKNAKKVEGTWTYYFNGVKQDSKQHNQTSFDIPLKGYKFGEEMDIKVVFSGKVDGKETVLSDHFEIFGLKVTYDNSIKGKDRFKIKVTNIDNAKGTWKVKVEDKKGKVVGQYSKKDVDGLEFSHAFPDFKAGKYKVTFSFEGKMHDYDIDPIYFDYSKTFDVNNESSQEPGNDNNGGTKPDPSTPNPEPKPQPKPSNGSTIPTDMDKSAAANGGVLPKTATSYPLVLVAGAALLIIGIIMYRRSQTSK